MDVARPYAVICPTLDSKVLNVLAGTSRPLTGREVARLAGRDSHSGVLSVLNRLVEHGLVDRVEAGRALLFTLNREHLAAPAVDVLAGMRGELLRRLQEVLDAWEIAPVHVSLFGSTARGDGDTESDIDLFVVRPNGVAEGTTRWQAQVDDLTVRIQRWTGNRASLAEAAESDLGRLRRDDPPIVASVRADAIVVHGAPITELFGPLR